MRGDVLFASLEALGLPMMLSDPGLLDNPVVFANSAFYRLTGYSPAETIGRNCRFLQGRDTEAEALEHIRDRLSTRRPVTTWLTNYRKDGTPFRNELNIGPVFDEHGELLYFVGSMRNDAPAGAESPAQSVREAIRRLLVGMDAAGLTGAAADDARRSLHVLARHMQGSSSDGAAAPLAGQFRSDRGTGAPA